MMILAAPNDGSFLLSLGSRYRLLRTDNTEKRKMVCECVSVWVCGCGMREARGDGVPLKGKVESRNFNHGTHGRHGKESVWVWECGSVGVCGCVGNARSVR